MIRMIIIAALAVTVWLLQGVADGQSAEIARLRSEKTEPITMCAGAEDVCPGWLFSSNMRDAKARICKKP